MRNARLAGLGPMCFPMCFPACFSACFPACFLACIAAVTTLAGAAVQVESRANVSATIDAKADGITTHTAELPSLVVNAVTGSARSTDISNTGTTHEQATEVTPAQTLTWSGTSTAAASVNTLRVASLKVTALAVADPLPPKITVQSPSGPVVHKNPMGIRADASVSSSFQDRLTVVGSAVPPGTSTVRIELAMSVRADSGNSANPNGSGGNGFHVLSTASVGGTTLAVTNNASHGGIITAIADIPVDSSFDFFGSAAADAFAVASYNGQVRGSMVNTSTFRFRVVTPGVSISLESGLDLSTPLGDATYDGGVNFNDLVPVASNYGRTGAVWRDGDFDGNGTVGFEDLVTLAQRYDKNFGTAPGLTAPSPNGSFAADWALAQSLVPEPVALMCALAASPLASRRRR